MIDKQLLSLLKGNKKYLVYCVILMIIGLLANLMVTTSICMMISSLINHKITLIPLLLSLLGIIIRYLTTRLVGKYKTILGSEVKKDLRQQVYLKVVELGPNVNDEIKMAALTQVSMEGIEQLDLYYSSYLPQFFYAMLAPIILFLVSIWIEWHVALVLIICVPLIPISIVLVSKYAKKIFAKYWGKYMSMGDLFLDSIQGLKELKIFKYDDIQQTKIHNYSEDFRKITMKVLVMQLASTTIMDLIAYGGAALGIIITLLALIKQQISIPQAIFLVLIAPDFFLPLRSFGSAFHVAMNGVSAKGKIIDLLKQEGLSWGDKQVEKVTLEVDHVTFSYDGQSEVLNDVSMCFKEKGMYGIVGESGCGKSTLVKLLLGIKKANDGSIKVNGVELSSYERASYYKHVGLVSYNTYLFNMSIRDNFKIANPKVNDETIYANLELVNLADFVRQNGGLDKVISEDGNNLSGGAKQRLALAINLATNKDIYIFDEASSNIDIESESIIMQNIKKIAKDKIVIVISHRLANVVDAKEISYLANGKVMEQGTHHDLMKLNQGYAYLYNRQKQLEEGYLEVSYA